MQKQSSTQTGSVIMFILAGLTIAGVLFLITFITSQRASAPHPELNLKIPVPSVPELPPLPRRTKTIPVITEQAASPASSLDETDQEATTASDDIFTSEEIFEEE